MGCTFLKWDDEVWFDVLVCRGGCKVAFSFACEYQPPCTFLSLCPAQNVGKEVNDSCSRRPASSWTIPTLGKMSDIKYLRELGRGYEHFHVCVIDMAI
jgi:hypothetical protein